MLSYERWEHPELVGTVSDLYRTAWDPLKNFFIPSAKLTHKQRIGSRYRRQYDAPQTSFQRLLQSDALSQKAKKFLIGYKRSLNPLLLKEQVETQLRKAWQLVQQLDKKIDVKNAADRITSRCHVF